MIQGDRAKLLSPKDPRTLVQCTVQYGCAGPERPQHSTYITSTDFKMTAIALLHAAYRNLQGFRIVVDSVLIKQFDIEESEIK